MADIVQTIFPMHFLPGIFTLKNKMSLLFVPKGKQIICVSTDLVRASCRTEANKVNYIYLNH